MDSRFRYRVIVSFESDRVRSVNVATSYKILAILIRVSSFPPLNPRSTHHPASENSVPPLSTFPFASSSLPLSLSSLYAYARFTEIKISGSLPRARCRPVPALRPYVSPFPSRFTISQFHRAIFAIAMLHPYPSIIFRSDSNSLWFSGSDLRDDLCFVSRLLHRITPRYRSKSIDLRGGP